MNSSSVTAQKKSLTINSNLQTFGSVYFDTRSSMIVRESLFSLDSLGGSLKDRDDGTWKF
ncbi:hypothetical protein LEP1GSC103_0061 [Leptospira borgpetersenii serovar Javanica str. UI 09931]|uniref:Uncharacterized protein n=1 Tax=Leptospira borgpetersenii serovar Javanica str. UI 09931 TaxID=1049767 RepID=A0AAV3JEZ8_LEPBO|nr:hypothetical protein [Leptospira borgpetersenii]AXX14849.1 hypothetical protein C4Q31_04120 [Leptospira borgpetersenii serovar Ceylonica]EKQ92293.1 hypothetical protein LEP1GSC101_2459 [Leptospira borgpetersenii str. UI 09149]EPG58663.1 hypothetical protein LEP1GSC103_0061 [Leptospira borgpetersenii serovar Javanica str. UI 09931]EMN57146.1 hypothetical protein LEP1GSC090_4087 [Leptospira borgpetersenii serovar Javanica str. MK146]MDQ7245320.1 hypothetical protein [Leptospira borgpetersenii